MLPLLLSTPPATGWRIRRGGNWNLQHRLPCASRSAPIRFHAQCFDRVNTIINTYAHIYRIYLYTVLMYTHIYIYIYIYIRIYIHSASRSAPIRCHAQCCDRVNTIPEHINISIYSIDVYTHIYIQIYIYT